MKTLVHGVPVRGVDVDRRTRCAHYGTERDVVAIAFACCKDYYPCFLCHSAETDHPPERWQPDAFDRRAVLCGACGTELRVDAYLDSGSVCPHCGTEFNPGCEDHYDRYFAIDGS